MERDAGPKSSPFPGMDPYLENPDGWPDFHQEFMTGLRGVLSERIAPNYLARLEERVYVTDEAAERDRLIRPGAVVASLYRSSGASVAVVDELAVDEAAFLIPDLGLEEHREVFLVIKLRQTLEVVTIIELLSPTNKRPVSAGRDEYMSKREQVLRSRTSLVELDLLRAGSRMPLAKPLPRGDYYALIHRERRRPMREVYPFTVRGPLPEIPIPLRGKEQVRIALQPIFETCYARARYDLEFDYSQPPIPPLAPEDAAWAAGLISARG